MSKVRTLSLAERWDLGLLSVMFIIACLCLTAMAKRYQAPAMFATDNSAATSDQSAKLKFTPNLKIGRNDQDNAKDKSFIVEEFVAPEAAKDVKFYNGKKFEYVKTLRLRVTAYAPDPRCCAPYDGTTTASGKPVTTNGGNLVAADTDLIPMHSLVVVPGYAGNAAVPVLDRGGAIKGHRLDVLKPDFDTAKTWGSRELDVKVYAPVK